MMAEQVLSSSAFERAPTHRTPPLHDTRAPLYPPQALVRLHTCLTPGDPWGTHAPITASRLDAWALECERAGSTPRVLLATNPGNPMGGALGVGELQVMARWCQGRCMHLIVNEMYLTSCYSREPATSCLQASIA